jgi:hypothetical protein
VADAAAVDTVLLDVRGRPRTVMGIPVPPVNMWADPDEPNPFQEAQPPTSTALLDLGEGAAAMEAARREQIEAARASSRVRFQPLLDVVYNVVKPPLTVLQAKLKQSLTEVDAAGAVVAEVRSFVPTDGESRQEQISLWGESILAEMKLPRKGDSTEHLSTHKLQGVIEEALARGVLLESSLNQLAAKSDQEVEDLRKIAIKAMEGAKSNLFEKKWKATLGKPSFLASTMSADLAITLGTSDSEQDQAVAFWNQVNDIRGFIERLPSLAMVLQNQWDGMRTVLAAITQLHADTDVTEDEAAVVPTLVLDHIMPFTLGAEDGALGSQLTTVLGTFAALLQPPAPPVADPPPPLDLPVTGTLAFNLDLQAYSHSARVMRLAFQPKFSQEGLDKETLVWFCLAACCSLSTPPFPPAWVLTFSLHLCMLCRPQP